MFKAFIVELRKGIFNNKLKILRMMGILVIPLVYSFIYIFAYFNPFADTGNLDVRVLVAKNDAFGTELVKKITKKIDPINVGEIKFKITINKFVKNPNDIYIDTNVYNTKEKWDNRVQQLAKQAYGTFVINPYTDKGKNQTLTSIIGDTFIDFKKIFNDPSIPFSDKITQFLNKLKNADRGGMIFYSNYQKNYIMGLGMDLSSSLSPTFQRVFNVLLTTDNGSIQKYIENNPNGGPTVKADFNNFIVALKKSPIINNPDGVFNFVNVKSQMKNFAEYGYGLAPFFISIGVWVGIMAITLGVHGKIYDNSISIIKTYFGKLMLMILLCFIQTTILFGMLSLIGFQKLGLDNMLLYWASAFLAGIAFCMIIQAIRFMVPHRIAGILIILGLVIFQMAASSGIFPTSLEFKFFQVIGKFLPFTYTVRIFREASFETNWIKWATSMGILFAFATPFFASGIIVYKIRKKSLYKVPPNPLAVKMKGHL